MLRQQEAEWERQRRVQERMEEEQRQREAEQRERIAEAEAAAQQESEKSIQQTQAAAATAAAASQEAAAEAHQSVVPEHEETEKTEEKPVVENGKIEIGPTNRPFTEEQSFLLHQRKAVNETGTHIDKVGSLDNLPEHLEPHREMLEEKNKKGEIIPSAINNWGTNRIDIDFGSIKDNDQAIYFATTLATDADKLRFFKEYAGRTDQRYEDVLAYADDKLGTRIFSSPQSNAGKRNMMYTAIDKIGLFDINGNDVKIGTADFDTVVQALDNIADEGKAKKAAAYVESLTKIPGNPYYGMTFDKEAVSYRDSANLPSQTYKDEVKALGGSFYTGEEAFAGNMETYLAKYEEFQALYGGDKYAFRQMERALMDAYEKQTGYRAPDSAQVQEIIEQTKAERALAAQAEAAESNKNFFDIVGDIWNGIFPKEKKEEEEETAPIEMADAPEQPYAMRSGYIASAGPMSSGLLAENDRIAEAVEAAVPQAEAPEAPEAPPEMQGPEYQPKPLDTVEVSQNQPPMSYMQAFNAHRRGEELSSENQALLARGLANDDYRMYVMNDGMTPSPQELMQQRAYGGTVRTDAETRRWANSITSGRQLLGTTLGGVVEALESGALPEDVTGAAHELLIDVMDGVSRRIRGGYIAVPAGENKYDYVIANTPHLKNKAEQLSGLQADVNNIMAERAVEAAKEYDRKVEDAMHRWFTGNATQEDLILIDENAKEVGAEVIRSDKTRRDMRYMLNENAIVPYYKDDGSFWRGNSAAAQEGRRLRETHSEGKYELYKYELREAAYETIDDLTNLAYGRGMTLEQFMARMNIGIDQVMDMSYNRINAKGAQIIADQELVQAADAVAAAPTKSIGFFGAIDAGIDYASANNKYHFMNTPYQVLDIATYDSRRNDIFMQYDGKYKQQAAHMYRKDLLDYANSGEMPSEEAAALIENIERADNIFDVAFEIDPGWLASSYREAMWEFKKDAETLETTVPSLPEFEQVLFSGASNLWSNAERAIWATGGTLVAGALGAPAWAARLVGSAAHSFPMFSQTLEDNEHAGLTKVTAANLAFAETAVMSIIESFGAEKSTFDTFFATALARNGMESALRQTGTGSLNVAKVVLKNMALDYGLPEAAEEVIQTPVGKGFDILLPAIKGVEEGTVTSPAQFSSAVLQELKATDPVELAKEAVANGAMGFVMGAMVSMPVIGTNAYKAVSNVNLQQKYASIDIASQIVHGEIPASDENIGRFIDAMRKDSKDPKFRDAYNKTADAAMQMEMMSVSAMSGVGHDSRVAAVAESKKADDYERKANAAHSAVETNKSQYARATKLAAEGNEGAMHTMEGFRTAWAKAQTTETENRQAAEKAREKAAELTTKWLHECRAVAKALVKTTKQSSAKKLIDWYYNLQADEEEAVVAEAEANAEAMEAEAFIEENYNNASDAEKDHIREIWGVPVNTKKEAEPAAATVSETESVAEGTTEAAPAVQAETDTVTAPQMPSEAVAEPTTQTATEPAAEPVQSAQPATAAPAKPMQTRTGAKRLVENRKRQIKAAERFAGQVTRRFGVKTEIAPANDARLMLPVKDEKGNDKFAPALYDRKEDKIIIGENATQGDVIRAKIVHELTHRTEGTEAYKEFSKAVLGAYYKTEENINAARNARKNLYAKNGVKLDPDGIESELVAYATEQLIGGNQEMVDRLVADSPSVARRIMDAIKAILDRLTGVKGAEVDQLRAVEQMFKKALDESVNKRTASYQQAMEQSNHPASVQFSVEQLAEATGLNVRRNDDGVPYTLIDENGNEVTDVTPDMIKKTPMGNLIDTAVKAGTVNEETANAQLKMFADLTTLAAQYKDQAMVWEIAGSQLFSAIKSNSDTQYGTTVDFGTICAKTQAIVDVMSETMLKLGRGLSRDEVIKTYRETANVGYNVPCPVCYVFSRWMGVPSLLNNIAEYQDRFTAMSDQEVKDYVSSVEERYAKGSDKPGKEINKAKEDLEKKLDAVTREMQNRLNKGLEMGDLSEKARALEAEYKDVEAYNWVTQALCKRNERDKNGQVVLDPAFEKTPKEILFDLRRTSEFSLYKKNWTYRSTRGAGMGKSILPYSGARIGDSVKGNKDRWSASKNPFLSGDMKAAARSVENGKRRMKAQNLIGGQRFQSTSDYRPEWGIDYMMTFLEMQAIGAKGQLYTKVIEAVDMFATAGIETNLSIMGKGNGYHLDENGNPVLGDDDFSSVTGIDFREAREKTKMYDNVQMILVGLNDDHIRLALANDDITFVIPWHSSGNSDKILSELMGAVGEKLETGTDYTDTQSDKKVAKPNAQQKAAADLRMRILTGKLKKSGLTDADRVVLDTNPYLADLYRRFYEDESATETYGVKLSSKQAGQVFPYEYWDTSLTIEDADENGRRFREYCESIGLEPRFPQFANDPGYWKLLIDRRMYNRDGTYHHPKTIDVTGVSIDSVAQSVGEVKYGDASRTDQAVQATIDNIRASIPAETYSGDAQYSIEDVPDNLMGFGRNQKGYDEQRYPKTVTVRVRFGDDVFEDEIKGMNKAHAMERARRNWEDADEISFVSMEDVRYSIDEPLALPDDDHLRAEIDAWRSNPNYSVDDNTGKRQFANKTIQNNQYIPDYIKQAFLNDPAKSDYSRESNMHQLNEAWNRVNSEGYEGAVNRLVNQETKFTPEDNADALIIMRQALHDGDLDTLMAVATKYNTEGTDQAKALQIRSLMRKMTPTGFAQAVIQDVSRKINDRDTKRPGEKRRRERESRKTKEDLNLGSLDDTGAAEKLERGESVVIDSKFGAVLNDAKRALIKEFGLEKTARPGDFYNWATTKQRMLEDILTTDDIWAKDSNGMDLVDRLVRMKHGEPVLTKADLEYITDQMAVFDRLADKNSREADLALARAHEAQGNINGATGRMKRRTWRYVSMLLSVPSAIRNVIGNTAQALPNAFADGIAVELDRIVSAIAGTDRTRAHLNAKDRIEGWEGFRDEVFNTFRDYFVDKAVTQHGEGRYNQSQMGRVYQTQSLETLRHLEGLLMSVGDRNFWKKKFLNSMAEQQRLAEINGTAFDVEAAMETAEAEANYATFNEDGKIRELMSALTEHIPFLDYLMPFVGVPTNIIKRQIEFSPIGIASTAIKHGWAAVQGGSFDQRAFVDGMARGLTGSAMMGLGALLLKSGFLKLGTKEEEDDKSYGVRTAQGDQYGVYFTIGDKNYSITTFSPAASALVAGAFVVDAMGDNERWYEALVNATLRNINEIFDASYMSSLADALNTSNGKTFTENLIPAIGSAMITQNIPAPLTHLASSLDPYVRDTKDKDTLMEIVNTTMNKIPGARNLLPEKADVAGRTVENTKEGFAAFYDPFTTSYVNDDPALEEMIRLRDVLIEKGASEPRAHMASDALSGRKNTLTQNKVSYTVTPEEKEAYRKLYGDLWRNGGVTYDKKGKRVSITQGVEELIRSRAYQLMTPEEQAEAIKKILQKAKEGATYQIMNHK
jgi:hypothetical protein